MSDQESNGDPGWAIKFGPGKGTVEDGTALGFDPSNAAGLPWAGSTGVPARLLESLLSLLVPQARPEGDRHVDFSDPIAIGQIAAKQNDGIDVEGMLRIAVCDPNSLASSSPTSRP
jgi:hypothetical protein